MQLNRRHQHRRHRHVRDLLPVLFRLRRGFDKRIKARIVLLLSRLHPFTEMFVVLFALSLGLFRLMRLPGIKQLLLPIEGIHRADPRRIRIGLVGKLVNHRLLLGKLRGSGPLHLRACWRGLYFGLVRRLERGDAGFVLGFRFAELLGERGDAGYVFWTSLLTAGAVALSETSMLIAL